MTAHLAVYDDLDVAFEMEGHEIFETDAVGKPVWMGVEKGGVDDCWVDDSTCREVVFEAVADERRVR